MRRFAAVLLATAMLACSGAVEVGLETTATPRAQVDSSRPTDQAGEGDDADRRAPRRRARSDASKWEAPAQSSPPAPEKRKPRRERPRGDAPAPPGERDAAQGSGEMRALVEGLDVAAETRVGYDRDLFSHWSDFDGDCRDTRDEVLAAESLVAVSGCDVTHGQWRSYYDGATWTASGDVDVDHLVPLGEAWDSGARRWSPGTRERFANDLGDERALVAVTDNVNQSKSDQDPAEWLPEQGTCRYVAEWAAVKARWSLSVDPAERDALLAQAADCPPASIDVTAAPIEAGPPPGPEPAPGPEPGPGGGCASGYDPCVPPYPPDLDCGDVDGPITVTGDDPHGLDGDGDGMGCTS
ncbi:MAG: HNH endonuclease family protein [Egibacteraceae bacterium]